MSILCASSTGSTAIISPMPAVDRVAVEAFYFDYAANLDRRETTGWSAFFTGAGVYSLTTYRNATTKGMYLIYEEGQDALTRRAAVASGYLKAQRNKTLHMIS